VTLSKGAKSITPQRPILPLWEPGTFWVDGAAAGADVTLETNVAFHGPTRWRPTGDPNLTAVAGEATVNFLLGRCQLRAVLAGATATTDLSVTITCLEGGW
jgi:hypothetical protein